MVVAEGQPVIDIRQWIDGLGGVYEHWGYLLVLLGALGENTALLGMVLPGGTLALLGAFYARQGTLNLGWVILFAWLGTVAGYHLDYLMGRYLLGHFVAWGSRSRLGQRLRLAGRVRLARALLFRHGGKMIVISHAIGHLRSFVALSAGAARMRYPRFLAYELVAALLWNTGYALLGYFLGTQRERLEVILTRGGWMMAGTLIAAFVVWRMLAPRLQRWSAQHRLIRLIGGRE